MMEKSDLTVIFFFGLPRAADCERPFLGEDTHLEERGVAGRRLKSRKRRSQRQAEQKRRLLLLLQTIHEVVQQEEKRLASPPVQK